MNRGEGTGLAVAIIGHAVLFGVLSVGFLATPNADELKSQPIDISLIDEVAFEAAAPASVEAPAESMAPDPGPLEDAAPPAPAPDEAQPEPPAPQPEPAPAPAPVPKAAPKAAPKRPAPAPEKAAPKATPRREAAPKTPTRTAENSKATGSSTAAKARPRSSRLGDDFLKGVVANESKGKAQTPRAQAVSAQVMAGLGQAIIRQVQPCADRITSPGPGANEIRSRVRLQMRANGTMAARPEVLGQTGVNDENRRYAQRVGELAVAAFIQCAPYNLPDEYYGVPNGWQEITINYRLPG